MTDVTEAKMIRFSDLLFIIQTGKYDTKINYWNYFV